MSLRFRSHPDIILFYTQHFFLCVSRIICLMQFPEMLINIYPFASIRNYVAKYSLAALDSM